MKAWLSGLTRSGLVKYFELSVAKNRAEGFIGLNENVTIIG